MREIKYAVCKPNRQFKSWHILMFKEPNTWYPVAYIRKPRNFKDKDFTTLMEHLAG